MSRRYILSEPAAHDLDLIKSYLVEHADVSVARHVLREIRNALQFLSTHPDRSARQVLAGIFVSGHLQSFIAPA